MQWQFQQLVEFFVPLVQFLDRMVDIPAACRSWYAQYIRVQQTVEISQVQFLGRCGRACCLATTGALVGSCRKLWSLRSFAVLLGVVQFLDKVVVPAGATTVGRAMLGSTMETCYATSRWLLEEFDEFLH